VLPVKARLLTKIAPSAAALRSRATGWSPALLAAVALTNLAGLAASSHGAGTGAARATAHRGVVHDASPTAGLGAAQHATVHAALYRVVGCRSRGQGAYVHGPQRREIAIGFDDGPAPDTRAFVTMLERAKARATFFMIGRQIGSQYRATLLRELRDGDALGDHSFSHPYLTQSPRVRAELTQTIGAIRSLSSYTPCVFRPPYGAYDRAVVRTARSLGLATVLWNDDPRDWALPGVRAIERQVLAQVRPGSIIISHDGGGPRGETLAAYPSIIASLRSRGYRIVTIPELLGFRPVYVPCVLLCEGIGLPRRQLPRDAIIEKAR
jgi:peptidoglycan/xylan/chitin deacetylase (PgdA/CDA1 family)